MFKVKISSNIRAQIVNKLRNTVNDQFIADIQKEVIDGEINRLIQGGVSPVASVDGGGRFKKYKDENKYPGKKKAKRPVNLSLTGRMLLWYLARKVSGVRFSMGIPSDADPDVKIYAEANNIGTTNSKGEVAIAARRFIPIRGELYAISIMRKIKNLYAKRIKALSSSK